MVNKKLTRAFKASWIGSIDLTFGSSVSSTIVRAFRPGRPRLIPLDHFRLCGEGSIPVFLSLRQSN
jgi:hypothetical protein